MGRKGRLWLALLIAAYSCDMSDSLRESGNVEILVYQPHISSKAMDPDENILTELTVMIFNERGLLEDKRSFTRKDISWNEPVRYKTSLRLNREYSIYACANMGMDIHASTIEELSSLKCHLTYPDEYREGIPMAGYVRNLKFKKDGESIELKLKRMMAKISIRMDRGGLSDDVNMKVVSAKIGNCPKSALLFTENQVKNSDDCFAIGFTRNEAQCSILNSDIGNRISGSLSFYMLENIQKDYSNDDNPQQTCSYIELEIDYESPDLNGPLIYRFFIGENENTAEVERNCHYQITVIPEDDGLSLDGWRVDKSGLEEKLSSTFFEMTPSGYMQAYVGEEVHIRCRYSPEDAEFDIGLEELEEDKARGIYDYRLDDDGKGLTLTMKSPGMGIIYMSAGEPINEAGILVIEVNE